MRRAAFPLLLGCVLLLPRTALADPRTVTLWHSTRDAEEKALDSVLEAFHASQDEIRVKTLAVPSEVMASKLTTSIPHGNGPDVFVFGHDRIGGWARTGILAPAEFEGNGGFLPETIGAVEFEGKRWGWPLSFKSVALYYNKKLVPAPPATTDELVAIAAPLSGDGRFGLAYETNTPYFHAAWYLGFGAKLFDEHDRIGWDSPEALASLEFVRDLRARGIVPEEVTGTLVASLFNQGKAAFVISGPWFLGDIEPGIEFGIAPLPIVSATGRPASPFLTVDAAFVSARAASVGDANRVAAFLAGEEGARIRAKIGHQAVANAKAWEDPAISGDAVLAAFRAQLATSVPMDNRPLMTSFWEPTQLALRKTLRGGATPQEAARAAMRRHAAITRPVPPPARPAVYIALATGVSLVLLGFFVRWLAGVKRRGEVRNAAKAWSWIAPAAIATAILIFLPFAVGLVLSFFDHRAGTWTFVGMANFTDILGARTFGPMEPLSFYYALGVTILWTSVNIFLHVSLGLSLALLLDRPLLRLKPVYRVLLVVPWAVPNYITALLWKGLFHKQFGAINGMLEALGIDGVSWFSSFWTAFFANVCTNAWLGFPFMMVVCLGALQSIPRDLYEAADVDGAGFTSKLRHITLPLLAPAMIPAVLLGIVWTFNQFNVVYLVSGGEPDNATDILISEAYRWAFARQEQYGYAAAYAALIFLLLLGWSALSARLAKAAEAMRG